MGVLKSLLKRVSGLFGNLWSFLALCIVAAVVLRVWVVAGYTIPTCSMEPLLHGAEEGGDKVAVFKPYYALFEPERFDLVAFTVEVPLDNRLLSNGTEEGPVGVIKRIVGLPGETILIRDGDIFFGQEKICSLGNRIPIFLSQVSDSGYAVIVFDDPICKSFFNNIHHLF